MSIVYHKFKPACILRCIQASPKINVEKLFVWGQRYIFQLGQQNFFGEKNNLAPLHTTIRNLKEVSTIDKLGMRQWAPDQR